jgi:hypothetical protein
MPETRKKIRYYYTISVIVSIAVIGCAVVGQSTGRMWLIKVGFGIVTAWVVWAMRFIHQINKGRQ